MPKLGIIFFVVAIVLLFTGNLAAGMMMLGASLLIDG